MGHAETLLEYLHQLWEERIGTDLLITHGNECWSVHSLVLAAYSKSFHAALFSAPKPALDKGQSVVVDITDTGISQDVMGVLLQYLYTGELTAVPEMSEALLKAANEFHIPSLANRLGAELDLSHDRNFVFDTKIQVSYSGPDLSHPEKNLTECSVVLSDIKQKNEKAAGPVKRGRGRPKKVDGTNHGEIGAMHSNQCSEKKNFWKPGKNPSIDIIAGRGTVLAKLAERGRGRPRIIKRMDTNTTSLKQKRGRGSPRKNESQIDPNTTSTKRQTSDPPAIEPSSTSMDSSMEITPPGKGTFHWLIQYNLLLFK